MTYKNLIIKISDACGLRRADVRTVLDAMTGNICEALQKGERVQLRNLGSFEVRERGARRGLDPRTREQIELSKTKSVGFRVSFSFREKIRNGMDVRTCGRQ